MLAADPIRISPLSSLTKPWIGERRERRWRKSQGRCGDWPNHNVSCFPGSLALTVAMGPNSRPWNKEKSFGKGNLASIPLSPSSCLERGCDDLTCSRQLWPWGRGRKNRSDMGPDIAEPLHANHHHPSKHTKTNTYLFKSLFLGFFVICISKHSLGMNHFTPAELK